MIVLVDVPAPIRDQLCRSQLRVSESRSLRRLEASAAIGEEPLHAIVIGPDVLQPLQVAAQAYQADQSASVVILGHGEQCVRIRNALRFAPLVGPHVECADALPDVAVSAISQAAARGRSRHSHREMLIRADSKLAAGPAPPRSLGDRYLATLMELAPIGILALDAEQRVVGANAEASRIFGAAERELLGRRVERDRLGPGDASWISMLASASTEPTPPSIIERAPEGPCSTIEARAVLIRDASRTGYLVVVLDVAERAKLEKQRAEALAHAARANRLKDEFLATVSHELRTPLNAVLGWARLLKSGLSEEKRDRAIETIERNVLVQAQLIEDLLDITRITQGKLRLEVERTDLAPVIEAAIDAVRPSLDAKQIHLTCTLDSSAGPVLGDPSRLQQIIWNLLSNAVKFSRKPDGRVRVTLARVDSSNEITVSDNGAGIASEFLPHVFDSFRQADGTAARRYGGLGLGLAITKHLVELHGGTIHVDSPGPGHGATFTVRIPLTPLRAATVNLPTEPKPRRAPTLECPSELRGLRVLIVDDELDSREIVGAVLSDCGALVRLADSASSALEALEAFHPSVLLSDIGMPKEDGYSLIAKVRALSREQGGAIPAAALTAYARAEDRRRALTAGYQMHVVKPVEPSELLAAVATLARMASLLSR